LSVLVAMVVPQMVLAHRLGLQWAVVVVLVVQLSSIFLRHLFPAQ
jgi:hypothetical protein